MVVHPNKYRSKVRFSQRNETVSDAFSKPFANGITAASITNYRWLWLCSRHSPDHESEVSGILQKYYHATHRILSTSWIWSFRIIIQLHMWVHAWQWTMLLIHDFFIWLWDIFRKYFLLPDEMSWISVYTDFEEICSTFWDLEGNFLLRDKSYCEISHSREAARFGVNMIVSLRNLP